MNSSNNSPLTEEHATYTPGYVPAKRAMLFGGMLIAAIGFSQLRTPLRLLLLGERTRAEATRVVKEKPGTAPIFLSDAATVRAALEPNNRSYIFSNEFRFNTLEGRRVDVRATVFSHLKPLFPLVDSDGLPTTVTIWYDKGRPERVVFPLVIGTWLVPSVMFILGLGAALIGAVLLKWATRPIALPQISPATPSDRKDRS